MKNNLKLHITVLSIYTLLVILYSVCSYKCDLLFGICGIQYLIYGLVFPATYVLLFVWKPNILNITKKINTKQFDYIVPGILYALFAIYVILVPSKIDFRNTDYVHYVQNALRACKRDANVIKAFNNNEYMLQQYCDFLSGLMGDRVSNKLLTKKQFNQIRIKTTADTMMWISQYSIRVTGQLDWDITQSCYKNHISKSFCNCYAHSITRNITNSCKNCSKTEIDEHLNDYIQKFSLTATQECNIWK